MSVYTSDELLLQARDLRLAGHNAEIVRLLTAPAESDERSPAERARLLRELAEAHLRAGDWAAAHDVIDRGLILLRGGGDDRETWLALRERKAWTFFREGKLEEAHAAAVPLQREQFSDPLTKAAMHNTLAGINWTNGRCTEAGRHMELAADLFAKGGDQFGAANAQTNLGILAYTQGRWSTAERHFSASETLHERIGAAAGRAANLLNLGLLQLAMGDHAQARHNLNRALRVAGEAGEPYDAARADIALAHLDLIETKLDEALRRVDAVLADRGSKCDDDLVQAACVKALVECDRGVVERALEIAEGARKTAHEHDLLESEADCCRALAAAYAKSNDNARAADLLRESIELAAQVGDPYRHGLALLDLALVCAEDQRLEDARTHLAHAEHVFVNLGARYDLERARKARERLG